MLMRRFDRDGSGSVDADELGMLLIQLGQRMSDQELEGMIKAIDIDGNGEIEFDEFIVMVKNKAKADAIKEGKPIEQLSYRDYGVRTFCSVNKPTEPRVSVRRRENATSMKPDYGHATTKQGGWVVPVGSIVSNDLGNPLPKSINIHPYAAKAWKPTDDQSPKWSK